MKKLISRSLALCLMVMALAFLLPTKALASAPTDLIHNYSIQVDVNQDGTLNMIYSIEWEVLESDGIGPVSWVEIGIPNRHYLSYEALSDNISYIDMSSTTAKIHFKSEYYEGETIDFSFQIVQDYMYQMNKLEQGYTVYSFTPGWFDEISVENLSIMWNNNQVESFTPDCLMMGDYNVWNVSLAPKETYTIYVTYPNDAFDFIELTADSSDDEDVPLWAMIIAVIMLLVMFAAPIAVFVIIIMVVKSFVSNSGFSSDTVKKVTRTMIVYYDTCQGCGATRKEGEDFCTYCGRSFIKSKEVIEEEKLPPEKKDILNYNTAGMHHYHGHSNTYIMVNVARVPKPASTTSRSTSSRSSGSSHHSSCAHSSCACASHCACACACACAGGGRAGCSVKDFYSIKIKKNVRR